MLRILGWAGYDTGLRRAFDGFTRDTGIAVSFKGVRNQDEMHYVAQTEAFDIACPTTDRLASWLDSRLIAPLDEDLIRPFMPMRIRSFRAGAMGRRTSGAVLGSGITGTTPRLTLMGSA
ncbi:MAG: hypothetical protein RL128_511 [Pseudomonadota bacterium]